MQKKVKVRRRCLRTDCFRKAKYFLLGVVWMLAAMRSEAAAGLEESLGEKTDVPADMVKPTVSVTAHNGFDIWYQKEAVLSIEIQDLSFSSGLAELQCNVKGVPVLKEKWPSGKEITSYSAQITVDACSRNGGKIPVTVEVRDHAGNQTTESFSLFIDGQNPVIQITGIRDTQITGRPVMLEIHFEDENDLREIIVNLFRRDTDGNAENVTDGDWIRTEETGRFFQEIQEDGTYLLAVMAIDCAGNQNYIKLEFTIDKTDPLIRYVEQLKGSRLQYFQWNYKKEERILGLAEYRYQILLNDVPYLSGTKVLTEGPAILSIRAVDSAGNVFGADAGFVIDHTEPVVCFGDIVSGEKYEKEVILTVTAESREDCLESILINGERQKLSARSRAFRFLIQEAGEYTVEVTAKDLAGNETEEKVCFLVTKKMDFLQRLIRY